MIAVLRLELWLTFWVALAVGLAFGLPVLEMNEGGVQGLLHDESVAKALARLAIALPFGLALFQFGLQRMRGTVVVLLHRGIEARDAFAAKFVLGMAYSSLVFLGVVLLEYRITVGQAGADPAFRQVLWVIPQMILLGAVSWAVGAQAVLGGGRSAVQLGLRLLFGGLAVVGVHRWAGFAGASFDPPVGYAIYAVLTVAAAAIALRMAARRFGNDGPEEPRGEGGVALRAALAAALLFPYFGGVRDAAVQLAQRGLQPAVPSYWTAPDGERLVSDIGVEGRTVLRTLDGVVRVDNASARGEGYEAVAMRYRPVWTPEPEVPKRLKFEGVPYEFPLHQADPHLALFTRAQFDLEGLEHDGWGGGLRDGLSAVRAELAAGGREVVLTAILGSDPNQPTTYLQRRARRSDGGRISAVAGVRPGPGQGSPLLVGSDGSLWMVAPALGEDALLEAPAPLGGELLRWSRIASMQDWRRTGMVTGSSVAAHTSAGAFAWIGHGWELFGASEGAVLEEDLDPADVGPILFVDHDPLGAHTAKLIGAGGRLELEIKVPTLSSRANSSRVAYVVLEVLRPPLERIAEFATSPFSRAHQAQLPVWLFGLHLAVGLACAGLSWRRGRRPRGRWLFFGAGLLAGPLGAAAVHVCRGDLDDAEAAGPAEAGSGEGRSVFLDAEASLERSAA